MAMCLPLHFPSRALELPQAATTWQVEKRHTEVRVRLWELILISHW